MTATTPFPGITTIYFGKREAMIAQVTCPDFFKGKYLVMPYGEGTYDAEGFDSYRTAKQAAKLAARMAMMAQGNQIDVQEV